MNRLKEQLKKNLEKCFSEIDSTKSKYQNKFDESIYTKEAITKSKSEMKSLIDMDIEDFQRNANYTVSQLVDDFKPNKEKINSMEYQIRLSNVIKLLDIDKNLDAEYFDFMVEAKDNNIIKLLNKKYPANDGLIEANIQTDVKGFEELAANKVNTLVTYLKDQDTLVPREVILDTL